VSDFILKNMPHLMPIHVRYIELLYERAKDSNKWVTMNEFANLGDSSSVPTIQAHIYHCRRALRGKTLAGNEVIISDKINGTTAYALGAAGFELLKLWEARG
jgi:hypothetical protein